MSEDLTQSEADYLLELHKKHSQAERVVTWPSLGSKVAVNLLSLDERETFVLDVSTHSLKLSKLKLQTRARTTVILVRLEIDGAPHRNPDDTELPCPHIHLYREGYQDKWAYPVPAEHFTDLSNKHKTLEEFMRFCRIVQPPTFEDGLFG
jgi:hypothetical protein